MAFSHVNYCVRMWLCWMFMERTAQIWWSRCRKVDLEQFSNKNGSAELLTITIKVVWRSLGLCTRWTFEFTSCSGSPQKCYTGEKFHRVGEKGAQHRTTVSCIHRGNVLVILSPFHARNLKHPPTCLCFS